MQVHKWGESNEVGTSVTGRTEGDRDLPRWAATAVDDALLTIDDDMNKSVVRQSASDSMLSSHSSTVLPGWSAGGAPSTSAASQSTMVQTFESSRSFKPRGLRATWGLVEPGVVRSQPTSVVSSELSSAHSDSADSVTAVVDQSSMQDTFTSLPISSVKYVENAMSLQDVDDTLMLSSVTDVACDLVDTVLQEKSGGGSSEKVSTAGLVSAECEDKRHVCPVVDQHVSKQTVAADERRYVRQVSKQSVGLETTPVDEPIHLKMSMEASAMTESKERCERMLVRSVEGQHVSSETFDELGVKPCILIRAEQHPTQETDSSFLVCSVFF